MNSDILYYDEKCYTCNPSKHVSNHIICNINDTTFHHDMLKRSMIIATPKYHYHDIKTIPRDVFWSVFNDIDKFMDDHHIKGYQCIYNTGTWQSHYHFHVKILIDEMKLMNMRQQHFNQKYFHQGNRYKQSHLHSYN